MKIIQIRAEINEMLIEKQQKKSNKRRADSLESNKTNKPSANMTKREKNKD